MEIRSSNGCRRRDVRRRSDPHVCPPCAESSAKICPQIPQILYFLSFSSYPSFFVGTKDVSCARFSLFSRPTSFGCGRLSTGETNLFLFRSCALFTSTSTCRVHAVTSSCHSGIIISLHGKHINQSSEQPASEAVGQANRRTDGQTNRRTDGRTDRQTDRLTDG